MVDTIKDTVNAVDSITQEGLKLADEATDNQQTSYEEIEIQKSMNMAKNITKETINSAAHTLATKWGNCNSWSNNSKSIEEEHLC